MELKDTESNLQTLRKLYGLLQSTEDGSQIASSECLDENARIFLKNLLDGATKDVLEAHSKVLAAQLGVFDPKPITQLEKLEGIPILKPPLSLDVPKTFRGVAPNSNPLTSREKERTPIKQKTQAIVSEKSKFSSSATEPENRKRRCIVCQQENISKPNMDMINIQHQLPNPSSRINWGTLLFKGLDLDKTATEPISSTRTQQQKVIQKVQRSRVGISEAVYDVTGKIEKKPDETDSKEVADAIRQVEMGISSLQLAAEHVGPSKKSAALDGTFETKANSILGIDLPRPTMQTKQGSVPWSELTQPRKFEIGRNDPLRKQVSQRISENKKLSQLPQVTSQKQKHGSVGNNYRSQMASQNTSKPRVTESPALAASQTSKHLPPNTCPLTRLVSEKVVKSTSTALNRKPSWRTVQVTGQNVKVVATKIESPSQFPRQNDHTWSGTLKYVQGSRVLPSRTNMAKAASTFLSTMPGRIDKEKRNQYLMPQTELIGKEYSLISHTRGKLNTNPTSSSGTEGYSSPGRNADRYKEPTSSSESEPSRHRPHCMSPISSSESDGCSSLDRVCSHHNMGLSSRVMDSTSTSVESAKSSISGNCARVKPKKQTGGLRRLKDRLALIFHHHHHHHHHHHDEGKHRDQKTKVGRGTSLWKSAGKIFHGTSKDEAYGERAAEKLTKSVVRKEPVKNQQGHFHTLVKGLLGHIRHSRKPKQPKGGIQRLGGSQRGSKKAVKKLQWWQMFRRQKAVKLCKPRVKQGLANKKPRLKSKMN